MARVFITGASRGLGLEFTRQMLSRGDTVFASCRDPQNANELHALKGDLHVVTLDVSVPEQIESAYNEVRQHTDALDLLINNAGIGNGRDSLDSITFENVEHTMRVNTVAPVMIIQRFLDLLRRGTNPKIVNLSSELGSVEEKTYGGSYAYSMSKAALNMMTRTLANDLRGDRITAFVIDPGWTRTDMGGRSATYAVDDSVRGMLKVIDSANAKSSGRYWRFNGRELPW